MWEVGVVLHLRICWQVAVMRPLWECVPLSVLVSDRVELALFGAPQKFPPKGPRYNRGVAPMALAFSCWVRQRECTSWICLYPFLFHLVDYICLLIYLFIYLFIYTYSNLYINSFIYSFVHLIIYLSIHLFYLFIYLYVYIVIFYLFYFILFYSILCFYSILFYFTLLYLYWKGLTWQQQRKSERADVGFIWLKNSFAANIFGSFIVH